MTTAHETTLTTRTSSLTVRPDLGARLGSLRVGEYELLRPGDHYGSFPMAPFCGRTRDGRFTNGGTIHQLPLNDDPNAIHGTARDHRWTTAPVPDTEDGRPTAAFTYDLAEPWPYTGRVTQVMELGEDALTLRMGIETYGDSFPGQVGWHPWFRRNLGQGGEDVKIEFQPAWQEERGADHLPTGRRIDPLPGPWDDCFGMPDGVTVLLTWPGELELTVTSPEKWVVVYDEQADWVCVEPQTGPPNGLNTQPRLITPIEPLEASTTWSWRLL
ncbi:aldose 1-epimerase [Streptomyces sp. NPDC088923]|uniref:aldose epimerase family protein n=1 Tax=Streptomyces sp. NPDC088923 TaxID=3365913 RepID=UPI00380DB918